MREVNGMNTKEIVEVAGLVIEGTSDIMLAMEAMKEAEKLKKWSGEDLTVKGTPVRVWYRGHYRHTHRYSSHQGRACPLGRGRAG